jgi:hypothetical protein
MIRLLIALSLVVVSINGSVATTTQDDEYRGTGRIEKDDRGSGRLKKECGCRERDCFPCDTVGG